MKDRLIKSIICAIAFVETLAHIQLGLEPLPFEWILVGIDFGQVAALLLLMPVFFGRPAVGRVTFATPMLPLKHYWPAWICWILLVQFGFHLLHVIYLLLFRGLIDYHMVRASIIIIFLLGAYRGRVPFYGLSRREGEKAGP